MNDPSTPPAPGVIPDTIGMTLETREQTRLASEGLTVVNLPGYELTRELGRGTFGTVWEAIRITTGQIVAIKIVEHSDGLNWEYFQRELDFLRELEEHPHTLTILDAQLDNDPPYIVMPLADGGSLEEAAGRETIPLKTIEKWLDQIAQALTFIHRKGVIHCDLKPANVLLSSGGDIRIADLGQARRAGHGLAMGTLGFMAPEQCAEETRSSPSVSWDVYGYGATAYWLLTGTVPRSSPKTNPGLSGYLSSFQEQRLVPIRKLNPSVDAELAIIVESCLHPQPAQRTPTMEAVLSDFHKRKHKEPLLCRRPWEIKYLVALSLRRRDVQVLLLVLLILFVIALFGWKQSKQNNYLAYLTSGIHAHESGRLEEAYLKWQRALDFDPGSVVTQQRLQLMPLARVFPSASKVNDILLIDADDILVSAANDGSVDFWTRKTGTRTHSIKHPAPVSTLSMNAAGTLIATASWDGKARLYDSQSKQSVLVVSHQKDDLKLSLTDLTFCKQDQLLATADLQGNVKLWDVTDGTPFALQGLTTDSYARQILLAHPSQPFLAALLRSDLVGLWDLTSGELLQTFAHTEELNDLKFSNDGESLVTASDDRTAVVWDLKSGKKLRSYPHESRVNTLLVRDDSTVITGCEDGSVNVWGKEEDTPTLQFLHRRPIRTLATNREEKLLAVGTGERESLWSVSEANGTVAVRTMESGTTIGGPWAHDGPVEKLLMTQDGEYVLSASGSARQSLAIHPGAVRAWHIQTPRSAPNFLGGEPAPILGSKITLEGGAVISHGENVAINQIAFDRAGQTVATASEDRTVRVWDAKTGTEIRPALLLDDSAVAVAFDASGKFLATASTDGKLASTIRIWEVESGYPTNPPFVCAGTVVSLSFSEDNKVLQAFTEDQIYTWDLLPLISPDSWETYVQNLVRARLDEKGSVVSTSEVSETVMIIQAP